MRRLVPVIVLAVSMSTGCHDRGTSTKDVARVRVIDGVPSPTRLDLTLDGHTIARHVKYADNSGYVALNPGQYRLGVRADRESATGEVSGDMDRGQAYTVVAINGRAGGLEVSVISENGGAPTRDRAQLRFLSMASDEPKLSLALDNVITGDGLRYKSESKAVSLKPGTYDVKLWKGDDSAQLLGPSPISLDGGKSYTVVAMGRRSDGSLTVRCYEDK